MRRFLRILALFALPIVLFYGLLAAVLVNSRELAPMDEIVQATVDGGLVLYGTSHHENFATYKMAVTRRLAPRLLVLGTSRSMQLRGDFFTQPSFYNAGGAVHNVANYTQFLQALPAEALPDTLLVVLDQDMFSTPWRQANFGDLSFGELEMDFFDTLLRTGLDYGQGKFSLAGALQAHPGYFGMAAVGRGSGFKADGSYQYGETAGENLGRPQRNFSQVYRDIDFDELRFQGCAVPDATALAQLEEFLAWCAGRDIRVVGFLPPFPPSVNARMAAAGKYGYLDTLYDEIAARFAAVGGEFFDFTAMADTVDDEYIDGFHGGDRVYAKIALHLAEDSAILGRMVDTAAIDRLMESPAGTARVLPQTA